MSRTADYGRDVDTMTLGEIDRELAQIAAIPLQDRTPLMARRKAALDRAARDVRSPSRTRTW